MIKNAKDFQCSIDEKTKRISSIKNFQSIENQIFLIYSIYVIISKKKGIFYVART